MRNGIYNDLINRVQFYHLILLENGYQDEVTFYYLNVFDYLLNQMM